MGEEYFQESIENQKMFGYLKSHPSKSLVGNLVEAHIGK